MTLLAGIFLLLVVLFVIGLFVNIFSDYDEDTALKVCLLIFGTLISVFCIASFDSYVLPVEQTDAYKAGYDAAVKKYQGKIIVPRIEYDTLNIKP